MNYRDYKAIMNRDNRIESPESVQFLADAIQLMNNIKFINGLSSFDERVRESFGIDLKQLKENYLEKKDYCINSALKKTYDRDWALESFGKGYQIQIEILKKTFVSRETSMNPFEDNEKLVAAYSERGIRE